MTSPLDRFLSFPFLHPLTRRAVTLRLERTTTPEERAAWERDNVPFLERLVAPVVHPHFVKRCAELADCRDWPALQESLGLSADAEALDWSAHAQTLQMNPAD